MLAVAEGGGCKVGPVALRNDPVGCFTALDAAIDAAHCAKADLLADLLIVELGLVVVLFGRRFKAGWRSHTQKIVIGLSTASMAQLAVRIIWQKIALHTTSKRRPNMNA